MNLGEILGKTPKKKDRKRVGRGPGSGHGKTSCRGHKGQNSRSGGGTRPGFEGGQMPLYRRLPKRGFNNVVFATRYSIVNVDKLNHFENGTTVTPELLLSENVVDNLKNGIKILGTGELTKALTVKAHKVSKGAREKIEAAKGNVELLA